MKTERFFLREIEDQDIHHIFRGLSHPEVIRYYGVSFMTLEATEEQMAWYADLKSSGKGLWWAIFTKTTKEFCGAGGFNDRDREARKAELGFWLLPEYWGLGIMQETMPVILQAGFEQLKLERIEGFVETKNSNCLKALHRLGFKHESTEQDAEEKNGRWIAIATFVKVRSEK
jgi:ribosomal-protein-alanine N-acetyltransferase